MKKQTKDKLNRFLFNFKNLTSLGGPRTDLNTFIDNEQLYKLDPDRFNFYMQVLESVSNPNPDVLTEVIRKENLTRYERERVDKKLKNIENYFENRMDNIEEEGESSSSMKDVQKLKRKLALNPLTQDIVITDKGKKFEGGDLKQLKKKLGLEELQLTNDDKKNDEIVKKYTESPFYSPNNEKVNMTDRLIFVVLTYIIRSLALFLVEWGIYTGYITDFNQAFGLYFGMYASILFLTLFLTNGKKDDMIFRLLFFYINTQSDDGRGVLRIIVHIFCILLLLPIPLVVREYREFKPKEILSFKEKSKLLNGIQTFSLYSWILTSVVAINV
jgi:Fe2+ transport system protein B